MFSDTGAEPWYSGNCCRRLLQRSSVHQPRVTEAERRATLGSDGLVWGRTLQGFRIRSGNTSGIGTEPFQGSARGSPDPRASLVRTAARALPWADGRNAFGVGSAHAATSPQAGARLPSPSPSPPACAPLVHPWAVTPQAIERLNRWTDDYGIIFIGSRTGFSAARWPPRPRSSSSFAFKRAVRTILV